MDIILFTLYSLSQGIREAGVFSDGVGEYMRQNQSHDNHKFFVIDRTIVGIGFLLISFFLLNESPQMLNVLLRGISFMLIFSFFRDGAYNLMRKKLDNNMPYTYLESWFYSSKTSTAFFDFNFWQRTVLLVLGGIAYYFTI